jgi:hypothetical protein
MEKGRLDDLVLFLVCISCGVLFAWLNTNSVYTRLDFYLYIFGVSMFFITPFIILVYRRYSDG